MINEPGAAPRAVEPLFVFSLPRSGSTLLQRLLSVHPGITGSNETWILLPPLYALRDTGAYAEYSHKVLSETVGDFLDELPGGVEDYREAVRAFAMSLYAKRAGGARYFLDKTPPYCLVVDEILDVFPDAKTIFLWRNPLSVVASLVDTYGDGVWNVHHFSAQIFHGLENLVAAAQRLGDEACCVRYDDLIGDPEKTLRRVCDHIDIAYTDEMVTRFTSVQPRRGDLPGVQRYNTLSSEPMNKWKETLANPIRKAWARRYLEWIGEERLAFMGYDMSALVAELGSTPGKRSSLVNDAAHVAYGAGLTAVSSWFLNGDYRAWPPRPGTYARGSKRIARRLRK